MPSALRRSLRALTFAALAMVGLAGGILALGFLAGTTANAWGDAYVLDAGALPTVDAALVLGTSPYGRRGQNFRTLSQRLEAAFDLWSAGRVRVLIVSGIRLGQDYDEAEIMRDGLMALGVPAEFIRSDPGGVRTWDQVLRAREVFGQGTLIVVSQRDHLARALFIARHAGIEAWGFAAEEAPQIGLRSEIVANLAMLRAYLDVVLQTPVSRDGAMDRVIAAGQPR